jgi:hypothetical protein
MHAGYQNRTAVSYYCCYARSRLGFGIGISESASALKMYLNPRMTTDPLFHCLFVTMIGIQPFQLARLCLKAPGGRA